MQETPPFVQQVVVGHKFELLLTAVHVQAQPQTIPGTATLCFALRQDINQQIYNVLALDQSAEIAHHNKLLLARALCTRFETVTGGQLHHCL